MRRLLVVFGLFAVGAFAAPTTHGVTLQLGLVDGGTLPTPVAGGLIYDVLSGAALQSDGGGWAFVGGGGSTAASWISAHITGLGSGQASDLTAGDHAKFDTVEGSAGSDITLDTSTAYTKDNGVASIGRFTLAANKTYRLRFDAGFTGFNSSNSWVQVVWVDAETGTPIGQGTMIHGQTYTVAHQAGARTIETIFTPGSQTRVEVRIMGQSGLTGLGANSTGPDAGVFGMRPHVFIEVL